MERRRYRPGMKIVADMKTESKGPEWVIRQGFACVCVQAPNCGGSGETRRRTGSGTWVDGRSSFAGSTRQSRGGNTPPGFPATEGNERRATTGRRTPQVELELPIPPLVEWCVRRDFGHAAGCVWVLARSEAGGALRPNDARAR